MVAREVRTPSVGGPSICACHGRGVGRRGEGRVAGPDKRSSLLSFGPPFRPTIMTAPQCVSVCVGGGMGEIGEGGVRHLLTC